MSCIVYMENDEQDFNSFKECMGNVTDEIEIIRCTSTLETLDFIANNKAEVVIISMKTNELGLDSLLSILRRIDSEIGVVIASDDKKDAYEAMQLKMDGFLLKPILEDNILNILSCLSDKLCTIPLQNFGDKKEIRMRTMPHFNMYVNGEPVIFKRKKGKELMAFLVNADGTVVNGEMIIESLWPGEGIGPSQRNRARVLVSCLKNFLKGLGLEEIFVTSSGQYYLSKKYYSCDVDELLQGDKQAIAKYENRYMEEYIWAQGRKKAIEKYLSCGESERL